ncbi:RmlC-like cupin domain-containing protein [Pseudomassariella vexata]|uniref:RmlC-like cupin domain-containing protein n=1 Tax=Pseudomassariella vexata TaxID=1141098 RepID=A0A1Y2EG47_9PEZI|nr:RmlC-like cupin domain-containing protein [Pseudomassariella vexata]ORY70284.1 RmlC-like cupin domain-containing protein [Pseudomassariella vexata]
MSFMSLIPDILPMILPSQVLITKARDLEAQRAGNDSPMIRQGAIIGKTDKMCASVMIAKPRCSSAVHHHGEQDTIIYAASGKGILVTSAGANSTPKKHELSPGDFAFVPPWTEHQEINETDADVVWILIRSGPEPVVVYLTDWGGDQAKAD